MFVNGANEITIKDIEDFLNGEGAATPAAQEGNEGSPATQPNASEGIPAQNGTEPTPVTETQAFAHRLKEATNKARNEERENIAKSLGYESYADMQQKREADMLRDKGFDPEEVSPVVEQLVQQRLADDPRLKEFDSFRQERVSAWAQKELAELKELTDGKISSFDDVPKDVIESWKTKGSLTNAYMELHGAELLRQTRASVASGQSRGSTGHLASPQGAPAKTGDLNRRPFTEQEREVYRLFNPDVTDEDLSKMYKET